ncbi:histidine kinase [Oryzobacter telluris]|uniref:histidine kinase n=1 Tax=Oryzobacter telluris TaxID=3149179 RepID=UPI00370D70E6
MELLPYAARLQRDVLSSARAGGEEAVALADLLSAALESSARLVILDALVEAAAEINRDLTSSSVDVRLRGREVDLVVTASADTATATPPPAPSGAAATATTDDGDEGGTARLSLRLPERLKPRIEEAADAAGLSVNAWLVRTVTAAVTERPAPVTAPTVTTGQRVTGWVR